MIKYLVIPLTKSAVSYCHYERTFRNDDLIDIETLKKAIFWAMKENMNIQFLYPDSEIPEEYKSAINIIDHTSIISSTCEDENLIGCADIVVFDSWTAINDYPFSNNNCYVIRTDKAALFDNARFLGDILKKVDRLVIVLTNPEEFTDEDFDRYYTLLDSLIPVIVEELRNNHPVHFNLLTDRIFLNGMNNCNAGYESITLAPDGNFYICPAFYLDGSVPVGNIDNGLDIKNQQLLSLNHAPICRICDAWQCRRCIWLNRKTTLEVNTPSHEQCVIAHIERNASRRLLAEIRKIGEFIPEKEIPEIDYLDPFDKLKQL